MSMEFRIEGADVFDKFLKDVPAHMTAAMQGALGAGTKLVEEEVRRRVVSPFWINRQDIAGTEALEKGEVQYPNQQFIFSHLLPLHGIVGVKPRWYFTSGLSGRAILQYRESLVVNRREFRTGNILPAKRIDMLAKPKLLQWAQAHDQDKRRQIFLGAGSEQTRRSMDTDGVVERLLPSISQLFETAVAVAAALASAGATLVSSAVGLATSSPISQNPQPTQTA